MTDETVRFVINYLIENDPKLKEALEKDKERRRNYELDDIADDYLSQTARHYI